MSEESKQPKGTKLKHVPKVAIWVFDIFAVLFLILAVAFGAFVWRVHDAPLDIEFAKSSVEAALSDEEQGYETRVNKLVLHWPDLGGPLLLGVRDIRNFDQNGNVLFSAGQAAFGLSKPSLMIGRIAPEALMLKAPSLRVRRSEDNQFSLGLDQGLGDVTTSPQDAPPQGSLSGLDSFILDLAGRPGEKKKSAGRGILSRLKQVEIENARVVIDDRVLGQSWWIPRFDVSIERTEDGVVAGYTVLLPKVHGTEAAQTGSVHGDMAYDRESGKLDKRLKLRSFDPRLLAEKIPEVKSLGAYDLRLDADVSLSFGEQLALQSAKGHVESAEGALLIDAFSTDKPLEYTDFSVDVSYANDGTLTVDQMQIVLDDSPIKGRAAFDVEDDFSEFEGTARLEVDALAHDKIPPLWPESLADDSSKEWIVDKMSDGIFRDAYAEMSLEGHTDDDGEISVSLEDIQAGFSFEGMTVDYREPLIAARKVNGSGAFDLKSDTLRIDIKSAMIDDITVGEGSLVFDDVAAVGAGSATIQLPLDGPLKTVLDYVSREPIAADAGMDLARVKGRAKVDLTVSMPTNDIDIEDVDVAVEGVLSDTFLPGVAQDADISGGPFELVVKDNLMTVKGKGQLSGQPIDFTYEEYLESSGAPFSNKVVASLTADDALRDKMGIDLSTFLSGMGAVDLTYTKYQDGRAEADVKADVTEARLYFDPVDYEKMPGVSGSVRLKAHLQDGDLQKITDLSAAAGSNFTLEPSVFHFRNDANGAVELAGGKTGVLKVGLTKGVVDFEILPSGLLKIVLDAEMLDLRPFLGGDGNDGEASDNPALQASITAKEMQTADGERIQQSKIYADIDADGRFRQLEMDAIAGAGGLFVRYKPDASGARVFRLEADDAGAALRAFDVYPNIRGGKLVIQGEPSADGVNGNLSGSADMTDFRVVKAPSLARLISAMSLPGLGALLNNEGLAFSRLQADYDWIYKPGGSVMRMRNGRTSGNSLGLTFEGTYNMATDKIDVGGTIVPISGVNNMLSNIPLVGEILTGGSGGIFAATYTIEGSGDETDVAVNPLSVLAPGILRRILFEGNPAKVEE